MPCELCEGTGFNVPTNTQCARCGSCCRCGSTAWPHDCLKNGPKGPQGIQGGADPDGSCFQCGSTTWPHVCLEDIKSKVKLIRDLCNYLREKRFVTPGLVPILSNSRKLFELLKASREDFDDCGLYLTSDDKLNLCMWQVSYHNGDPYGEQEYTYEFTDEICDVIIADLEHQYNTYEFQRLAAEEEAERKKRIESRIIPAKKRFK